MLCEYIARVQMSTKANEILSFDLYVSPDGNVHELSAREANTARRLAGAIELEPGGMVVMSTDVNATVGKGKIKGWAKGFMKTWFNRIMRSRKIDDTMKELLTKQGLDSGWSIGNLFKGRYFSPKSGDTFNEKSFSLDIRGVPFKFVKDVAKVLAKKFDQESVLVVDNKSGRTFLLD